MVTKEIIEALPRYMRPVAALSVPEFCEAFRLSTDMFGKMQREGWAPRTMRVGRRVLISVESAEQWRRDREREAAVEQGL